MRVCDVAESRNMNGRESETRSVTRKDSRSSEVLAVEDIFCAKIAYYADEGDSPYARMKAVECANETPIEFDITDCDWYVKL